MQDLCVKRRVAHPHDRLLLHCVVCLCIRLWLVCLVSLYDILHSPCKSQRKGQALPEWLASGKMLDFIYRAVNMSLTAAGFLGLSSVTGHLISQSLTLPGRKHTFCFQECHFSHPTMDFPNCKLFSSWQRSSCFANWFFPSPPVLKNFKWVYNESEDYRAYSAHRRLCKLSSQVRKWEKWELQAFHASSLIYLHTVVLSQLFLLFHSQLHGAAQLC